MNRFCSSSISIINSLDEISKMDGFLQDNPVTEQNYSGFIAEYNLTDMDAHCCFSPSEGQKCNQAHKHGFVVRLKDGTSSILGNNCAREKFADESLISQDLARWNNEKNRQKKLGVLSDYVSQSDEMLDNFSKIGTFLKAHSRWKEEEISSYFGVEFLRSLEERAKQQNPRVSIEAVFLKKNKDGEVLERQVVKYEIGVLEGIKVFDVGFLKNIYELAKSLFKSINSAIEISSQEKPNVVVVNNLVSSLSDYKILLNDFNELKALKEAFLKNKPEIYCYVCNEQRARNAAADKCMKSKGDASSKSKQKEFIKSLDKYFCVKYGATSINLV